MIISSTIRNFIIGLLVALFILVSVISFRSWFVDYYIEVGLAALFIGSALILWFLPKSLHKNRTFASDKEQIDVENTTRDIIIKSVGGFFLVGGLIFTANQIKLTKDQVAIQQKVQINTQLSTAIELIAADPKKDEFKVLSGIYALGQLSQNSPEYQQMVVFILCSYLRKHSRIDRKSMARRAEDGSDLEACKEVFGRLSKTITSSHQFESPYQHYLDNKVSLPLSNTYLSELKFDGLAIEGDFSLSHLNENSFRSCLIYGGKFKNIAGILNDFSGALLSDCNFSNNIMQYTNFGVGDDGGKTILDGCVFFNSSLVGSSFSGAIILDTQFSNTDLKSADFDNANLFRVKFNGADAANAHFDNAIFERKDSFTYKRESTTNPVIWGDTSFADAELMNASFKNADLGITSFQDANISKANFSGADLSNVRNMTKEQLSHAIIDKNTKLPKAFLNGGTKKN